jgi:hypothetical protein
MYQQLPEFVRREPKAYWFITTMQALGGVAGLLLPLLAQKLILAPVGAIGGVILFTKRHGLFIYEQLYMLGRWLRLFFTDQAIVDPRKLFRTTQSTAEGVMVVRQRGGPTVAIRRRGGGS